MSYSRQSGSLGQRWNDFSTCDNLTCQQKSATRISHVGPTSNTVKRWSTELRLQAIQAPSKTKPLTPTHPSCGYGFKWDTLILDFSWYQNHLSDHIFSGSSKLRGMLGGSSHLVSGMSHQVWIPNFVWKKSPGSQFLTQGDAISSERPLRGPAMAPCLPGKPTARTGNVYHGVVSLCYLQWICTLVHIFSVCLEIEGE